MTFVCDKLCPTTTLQTAYEDHHLGILNAAAQPLDLLRHSNKSYQEQVPGVTSGNSRSTLLLEAAPTFYVPLRSSGSLVQPFWVLLGLPRHCASSFQQGTSPSL